MTKPLAIDLFCGLFGWSEGLIVEGFRVVGFDLEDMHAAFGLIRPPEFQLVIQDVLTLHGSQFRDADLIVASPPCQAYSYRAMPWSRAKALPPPCNALFEACFRIQREAIEAAGRHIPLIVENVRGAQPWVGRARWNFGSFYLWGDVPALMPITLDRKMKALVATSHGHPSGNFHGYKTTGMNWSDRTKGGDDGIKQGGTWWHDNASISRISSYGSLRRKAASALIAKIPLPLSRHIGAVFYPILDAQVAA